MLVDDKVLFRIKWINPNLFTFFFTAVQNMFSLKSLIISHCIKASAATWIGWIAAIQCFTKIAVSLY